MVDVEFANRYVIYDLVVRTLERDRENLDRLKTGSLLESMYEKTIKSITDLNVSDYAFLMGATVDANGGVTDSVDNVAPYVALGFEIPLSKGGTRLFWYYKGKFGIPSSEHNTKQGSVEYQPPTISGKFLPREDGKWRYRLDANETNADVVADWFNKVQEEPTQLP